MLKIYVSNVCRGLKLYTFSLIYLSKSPQSADSGAVPSAKRLTT